MYLKDDEAVVAQATAIGAGAIGMIRISGINTLQIIDTVAYIPGHKKLTSQNSHTIHYGWIIDKAGNHVDQVLFLLMRGPKTFTGQDVIEITCHNNQFLIEQIIDIIIQAGARLAENGEFTRRAVLNNKVDLVQAEAINELIHAQTSQALKLSLRQLKGSFSSWIANIEKQLIHIVAYCQASFEFLDEEMTFDDQIRHRLNTVMIDIENVLKTFDKRHYIKQGVRIALVGSVNVGKSSLFNALIHHQRAIVTDIAGTTRDTIEAGVYQEGAFVTFIDTAGLRESDNVVEKIGIDKSFEEITSCDLILVVFDATQIYNADELNLYESIAQQYKDKIIFVQNKIDLGNNILPCLQPHDIIPVSVIQNKNIDILRITIDKKIDDLMKIGQSPCLLNKRQHNLLFAVQQQLGVIQQGIYHNIEYELLVVQVTDAITKLSELTGKTVTEDALDAIFREFCVGK